jgi:hypothetical protein
MHRTFKLATNLSHERIQLLSDGIRGRDRRGGLLERQELPGEPHGVLDRVGAQSSDLGHQAIDLGSEPLQVTNIRKGSLLARLVCHVRTSRLSVGKKLEGLEPRGDEPGVSRDGRAATERSSLCAGSRKEDQMTSLPHDQEGSSDLSEEYRRVAEILHRSLDDLPLDASDGSAPRIVLDLFVVLDRDEPFALARVGLDMLATELADTFGQMWLSAPTAYNSDVMLHAQVVAPGSEAVRAGIEEALATTMREFLGPDVQPSIAVRPRGEQSRETAVVQVFFPLGTDLELFAREFSSRDYFRWQVELASFPGVGAVNSEPCSALGADVPMEDLLPPNLMISFAVLGDLDATVRGVLSDLERRLGNTVRPMGNRGRHRSVDRGFDARVGSGGDRTSGGTWLSLAQP